MTTVTVFYLEIPMAVHSLHDTSDTFRMTRYEIAGFLHTQLSSVQFSILVGV